jgi:plastocyanin
LAAALSVAACSGGGGGNASGSYPTGTTPGSGSNNNNVPANSMLAGNDAQFNPSTLVATKGVPVNFIFADTVHTLYFVGNGKPNDMPAYNNRTVQATFTAVGTVYVYCKTHSYMNGQIIVQ